MDFFLRTGLVLVLLIQHYNAQDPPGSTLPASALAVKPHVEPSQPQGAELSPGDTVVLAPAVAPPSMREVEQAVQEASEQVEGGGAEEVLKGLLERVVEAARSEAGGAEGKAGAEEEEGGGGAVGQVSEEEELGTGVAEGPGFVTGAPGSEAGAKGHSDAKAALVETATAAGGEEGETVSEWEEATRAGADGGAEERWGEESAVATSPVLGPKDTPVVEPRDILEKLEKQVEEIMIKAGGEVLLVQTEDGGGGGSNEEEEEKEEEEEEEITEEADGEGQLVRGGGEPGGAGELGGVTAKEESGGHVADGSVVVQLPPGGDGETGGTPAVLRPPTGEQEQQEVTVENSETQTEEEETPGSLDLEVNGGLGEVVAAVEAAGGEGVEGAWEDGAGVLGADPGVPLQGEEWVEPDAKAVSGVPGESSLDSPVQEQEVLVFPPGESEHAGAGEKTSTEQQQQQDSLPSPALIGGETGSDHADGEEPLLDGTNHTNEIPSPDDLLTHDPAEVTPAEGVGLDQAPATPPAIEEVELGKANELVEDEAGRSELGVLGVEAWKIGGIAAAVVVVLETLVIVIYILKCRGGAKSAPAPGACEEGRVEPEAATGGDCSDDSLPASNGDTQLRIAELDPSDVTSALAQHKEKPREQQQEVDMSDLPPGPAPGSAQGSSQDLRTSVL